MASGTTSRSCCRRACSRRPVEQHAHAGAVEIRRLAQIDDEAPVSCVTLSNSVRRISATFDRSISPTSPATATAPWRTDRHFGQWCHPVPSSRLRSRATVPSGVRSTTSESLSCSAMNKPRPRSEPDALAPRTGIADLDLHHVIDPTRGTSNCASFGPYACSIAFAATSLSATRSPRSLLAVAPARTEPMAHAPAEPRKLARIGLRARDRGRRRTRPGASSRARRRRRASRSRAAQS